MVEKHIHLTSHMRACSCEADMGNIRTFRINPHVNLKQNKNKQYTIRSQEETNYYKM